jgi:hypothetical protein
MPIVWQYRKDELKSERVSLKDNWCGLQQETEATNHDQVKMV